jgi:ribonuclease P protein component
VLAAAHRLTDPAAFSDTVRSGVRSGSRALVAHLATAATGDAGPRVGVVVSKAVGNAVVRNRVKRRLRHQVQPLLPMLPASSRLVVRALPAAAGLTSAQLAEELGAAVARCVERSTERVAPR